MNLTKNLSKDKFNSSTNFVIFVRYWYHVS